MAKKMKLTATGWAKKSGPGAPYENQMYNFAYRRKKEGKEPFQGPLRKTGYGPTFIFQTYKKIFAPKRKF